MPLQPRDGGAGGGRPPGGDARSVAAVKRLADATSGATTEIRLRIHRLDHWGVNSHLLSDYEAMLKLLDGEYAAARVAALTGDPGRQDELRARWDQHLKIVDDWLTKAKNAEDEP